MYTPRHRVRTKKKGPFRSIRVMAALVLVIIAGLMFGYIFAAYQSLPEVGNNMRPAVSSQVFDSQGKLITTLHSDQNRLPIDINKVPKNLQNAFIAAEDNRFYDHIGVDPIGILRAVVTNLTNRGIAQGGSTITQQLAKNAFLSQDQTLKRKIQEAILALELERKYSKKEILEMYMNQIYFGRGAYGIQTAAHTYFGKDVGDLTLAECAMIAGLPKSPNYYSSSVNEATARKNVVVGQMEKYGYITPSQAEEAKKSSLDIKQKSTSNTTDETAYFIDYVTQEIAQKYGDDALYKDGLKIYTTLDTDKQHAAVQAMRHLPETHTDDQGLTQPQGAIISIDPKTGHILAMVGGRGQDSFNRASMAVRQPGSAFKPFVYMTAMEHDMTPDTIMEDKKVEYGGWSPHNADNSYQGRMPLWKALALSVNTVAVQLADKVGPSNVIANAKKLGITTLVEDGSPNDDNLASAALGGLTKGVTPLEMAAAYGAFANKGVYIKPTAIVKILDRNGNVLEDNSSDVQKTQVMSEKTAYEMTSMLEGVITRGTGTAASIGRPAAGKTGTTDDNHDAWFIGYTPDIVTAVWVGDDTGSQSLGEIYGGTVPAQIWHDYMASAVSGTSADDFDVPAGMGKAYYEEPKEAVKSDKKNDKEDKKEESASKDDSSKQSVSDKPQKRKSSKR
ncbi:transglycosylase domain-containing protein [Anaeroglobus sp. AF13-6AC]|uniref:transglycosylase domain-containing protein n=1 Tax=Anaeroglobus sp. AF13-6AC TaxID=2997918 RepID=UPI0022E20E0D|nr:penicillin-binding protein 1A [Anaeroglobus sp. AF13-6AC]